MEITKILEKRFEKLPSDWFLFFNSEKHPMGDAIMIPEHAAKQMIKDYEHTLQPSSHTEGNWYYYFTDKHCSHASNTP